METSGSFHWIMGVWGIPPAKPLNPADVLAESEGTVEWLVEER